MGVGLTFGKQNKLIYVENELITKTGIFMLMIQQRNEVSRRSSDGSATTFYCAFALHVSLRFSKIYNCIT